LILAGKGDIWIGHIDGFAQAARRGAPVVLTAITAWSEKFQFLTLDTEATSPQDLAIRLHANGEALAVVPQGSPAHAFLDAMTGTGLPKFKLIPASPQYAGIGLSRGQIRHLMVPEPLASGLITKFPQLRRIGSLADIPSGHPTDPAGLPMAGVAVRAECLAAEPALIADLTAKMRAWTERNHDNPAAILPILPADTRAAVGEEVLANSLHHDPLKVEHAAHAKEAVRRALAILDGPHPVADSFFAPASP
ncbi:MAG: hypothetical protein JXQ84_08875, partial [Rhodospirillaceae bacterium]|nr:hypothetical protein [Rhodospirillaceae bacterium]